MLEIINGNNLLVIAGTDATYNVDFMFDDKEMFFEAGDIAEMIIHGETEDIHIKAKLIEKNIAYFYLSEELTKSLLRDGATESYYEYCIRVKWVSKGSHIPIHRKTLTVKRC